mmetsp:Transcript_88840/g.176657  ORF Transcript_88840/g.176657 Transcript_88840/m.176657 type:complete len:85 (+) Transcript_88840:1779-2033(+)
MPLEISLEHRLVGYASDDAFVDSELHDVMQHVGQVATPHVQLHAAHDPPAQQFAGTLVACFSLKTCLDIGGYCYLAPPVPGQCR